MEMIHPVRLYKEREGGHTVPSPQLQMCSWVMKRPLEREQNRLLECFTLHLVLYFYFDVIFGDIFVPHAWILMKPSLNIHLLSMTSFFSILLSRIMYINQAHLWYRNFNNAKITLISGKIKTKAAEREESRFLLQRLNGGVRTGCKRYESKHPSRLVLTVQAWPPWCPLIVADHVHPFIKRSTLKCVY